MTGAFLIILFILNILQRALISSLCNVATKLIVKVIFHKAQKQISPKLPGRLLQMLVMGLNSGDSDSASLGWGPRLENHPPGSGLGRFINSSLYSTRIEVKTTESENSFSKKKNAVLIPC